MPAHRSDVGTLGRCVAEGAAQNKKYRCAIAQPADLERVVDALAAHGAVTTSLVLSSPVNKSVTVHAAGAFRDR